MIRGQFVSRGNLRDSAEVWCDGPEPRSEAFLGLAMIRDLAARLWLLAVLVSSVVVGGAASLRVV
jgi:hypothetical protein